MMDDKNKKELIEDIVSQLKQFEMPYKKGSWERFVSDKTKRSPVISSWKYWTAAAALIAALGISYVALQNKDNAINILEKPSATVVTTPDKENIEDSELKKTMQRAIDDIVAEAHLSEIQLRRNRPFTYSQPQQAGPAVAAATVSDAPIEVNTLLEKDRTSTIVHTAPETKYSTGKTTGMDKAEPINRSTGEQLSALYNGSGLHQQATDLKNSFSLHKWEIGAFVSPSTTSTSVTLGGGLSLAYNVSSKVSIRSGVSMQQYGAASPGNNIEMLSRGSGAPNLPASVQKENANNSALLNQSSSADNQANERVSGKILTVDVPLDVRYAISKHVYASVGVSYVGIVDQERTRIYDTENAQFKEKSNETNVAENKPNGFVNFSVGRKQKVGGISISIEPYFKTPIGGLKSSDLNYNNGGIKIITSF